MTKKCNGNCCDGLPDDYGSIGDDYDIDRLKDIIEICEFLIQTKEHRKQKRQAFRKIFEETTEKDEDEGNSYSVYRYKVPTSKRVPYTPYWDRFWF